MIDILSLYPDEIKKLTQTLGEQSYRADQIRRWLNTGVREFSEMANIPKTLIEKLESVAQIKKLTLLDVMESSDNSTAKYVFSLEDGEVIESVLMRYNHGNSVCVSTQAGCKMGCTFCASTKEGFRRNLTPSEMLLQISEIKKHSGQNISNLVLMGIGEPLDNYDNVIRFIRLVNQKDGHNIGMRHISLSTCGIVDKIYKLADEGIPLTLSISLHAADDDKRKSLMPIANKWTLPELIASCKYYIQQTGRRISFEYIMISEVNDSAKDAEELGELLSGMLCHLNLIPLNPIKERNYKPSDKNQINLFTQVIKKYKINVTVRRSLGGDVNASCGQLRVNHSGKSNNKRS